MNKFYYKQIIALIMCFITLFSTLSTSVMAWTSNEGEKASSELGADFKSKDGDYYYYPSTFRMIWYDEDGNTSHHWYPSTKKREKYILDYKGEKKAVYCLEAGIKFDESDDGYESKSYENSSYFRNLPYAARYGITLALVYGYVDEVPNELKSTCNMDDYMVAVQNIIWEYQQQLRTSPTEINDNGVISKDMYYDTIKGRPAEDAYNWVLNKLKNHRVIPSFSSSTISDAETYTLKYDKNTKKYTLTLTDNNNTLVDIKFENNSDIKVTRSGNKYTFTSDNAIANAVSLTAKKDISDSNNNLLIWGRSNRQTMVTGTNDPVSFYLKINTESNGVLHLKKTSDDGKVSGIKFTISGNNQSSQTITTQNDGTFDIELLAGTYTITEDTPRYYETQQSQTVTINPGETKEVEFKNSLKRGNLTVYKTSEDNDIKDVRFHLYGTALNGSQVDLYATTDENGIANFNNILISNDDGYVLEEVDTKFKYIVPPAQNVKINWNEVTKANFENDLKRGSLKIIKTSEDNLVEGIRFHLYGTSLSGKYVDEYAVTNSQGIAEFNDILISDNVNGYTIEESNVSKKYVVPEKQTAVIEWNKTTTKNFHNKMTRGDLKITKTAEDNLVEGLKFHLYGTSLSGKEIDEYAITDSDGIALFKDILISDDDGYTIEEVNVPVKYVVPKSQTATIEWNKVTTKNFDNRLKKFNVTVTKVDSETRTRQGNATLEGAIYGIYNNGELVDEYTTDKDGKFTTAYYVCGDNWTIKEISPSVGYNKNPKEYHVGAEPTLYTIEYNSAEIEAFEDVIKGKIAIIKHTDDGNTQVETPEEGAKFEVYLTDSGSYANAKESERDILTCNTDGFAETKYLPYGDYTIHQISGWDNREFVKDIPVKISINNKTYRYLINNRDFESYIKMVKKDADTGKTVTLSNATFSLYRLNEENNEWEKVKTKVGNKYYDSWTTDDNGIAITENKLVSGHYKILEVKVPAGFLQLENEITFDVTTNNETKEYDDDYDAFITVTVANKQPTATLEIEKLINLRNNVDKSFVDTTDLSKIKFKLSAKEDIISAIDGSVLINKGTEIGSYNLSQDGKLKIEKLYLGSYELQEIETLPNLVLNDEKYDVIFTYENDNKKVYVETLNISNDTTFVEISKTDITGNKELEGAKLTILDENGKVIDSWTSTNKKHTIEGLNVGKTYTLREEIAPRGYVISTDIQFTIQNTGKVQKVVMIDKVVEMAKTDIGGEEIEGAEMLVLDKDGNVVDEWTSTKEPHRISNLKENETYTLHEEVASEGYVVATDIEFEVTTDKETQKLTMIDKVVEMTKTDISGEEIEGAEMQVLDKDGNVVDEWTSTKEAHKISNLKENETYTLHEEVASEGYVVATDIEFEVTTDKETQMLIMIDKIVEVIKTDLVTGEEIEGAELQVIDEDGNIIDEWISGKESHRIIGLEEKKNYKLVEKTAPYGFELTEEIEFTVTEEKIDQKIEMQDKPILTNIRVVKIDSETKEIIKDKFTFGIYADEECKELIQQVEANTEDGYIEFTDLRYGKFYIKELSAPNDYELSNEVLVVEINDKGVFINEDLIEESEDGVYCIEFENVKIEVPDTGDSRNMKLWIILFIMSAVCIAGTGVYEYKKKKAIRK